MWETYVQVGVTLLLQFLRDGNELSKRRKMFLKLFGAIAAAYAQDAEFRKVANEALK